MTGKEGGSRTGTAEADPPDYSQGYTWEVSDAHELAAVLEAAFDYRGDVTLRLVAGEAVTGYVANRDARGPQPFLDVFPSDGTPRRRIPYAELVAVVFSGKDTASGKSWESWVRRWKAKKEAEARGEETADIGLYPEKLD